MIGTFFRTHKAQNLWTSALIYLGVFAFAVLSTQSAYAFGVGVQPSTVEMTVKPGDRHRQVVTVGNVHKTKTISMTIGLADWTLNENGELALAPPGETDRSAADWIRFSPASVTLKPETKQDIVVEISVPVRVDAKGDHRFALLATTMLPELDERGDISGVWNKYQLASLFYLTLTPAESTPVVENVAMQDIENGLVALNIENQGDAHARLGGTAFIKSQNGDLVGETKLSTVVLDRGTRNYAFKLADFADLDAGAEYNVEFEMTNSFAPQNNFRGQPVSVPPLTFRTPVAAIE